MFLTCVKSSTRAGRTCDVIFTNHRTRSSIWIVMHPSSHLRLEFDGSEVKVLITDLNYFKNNNSFLFYRLVIK
jgi:hypothetical protein